MYTMFDGCSSLTSLTLPAAFDTSKVTTMSAMFYGCSKLASLTLPAAFDTSRVENMTSMFRNCSALASLTLGKTAQLRTGTGLSGLRNSTNPFWIKDMQTAVSYGTTEADAVENINNILSALPDTGTQTFTKASMRLTYDANQGHFPKDPEPPTPVTTSYLYGNPGDKISDDSATQPFNYTPVPVRENYGYSGYADSATATTAATPTEFPAEGANTTFYAVWDDSLYTVVFDANGLTFTDGATQKTLTFNYGEDLVAPELSIPEGVEFEGWFTAPEGGDPMPSDCTQSATYYAHSTTPAPGPTPEPTPTPEPSDGDLIPLTGDPLSGNFMAMFFAAIVATGMILLISCRVSRKGESE